MALSLCSKRLDSRYLFHQFGHDSAEDCPVAYHSILFEYSGKIMEKSTVPPRMCYRQDLVGLEHLVYPFKTHVLDRPIIESFYTFHISHFKII